MPDIAFRQVGYLFLLDTPELVATFRAALAVQHAHGVPSRELTPARPRAIVPQLELDGVLAATFCPRDGHMSPEAVVQGYAAAAVARGARVVQGCPATGIELAAAASPGCAPRAGRSPPTRSCAPRARGRREVGAMVGVEIPVHGEPRHMWFSPELGGRARRRAAHDRLQHELLLPPRGPGHRLRRPRRRSSRRWPSTRCGACRWSSTCRSRAAGGATTRSAPTTTRSWRVVRAGALPVRDGVLRAWLPAGARRSASTSRSSSAASAGVRPERLLARALRARRAARRALRRVTAPAARENE